MNPPYDCASSIIKSSIDRSPDKLVILAPYMKYRKLDLYQYIEKTILVNKKGFEDKAQDIKPDLLICRLTNQKVTQNIIDVEKYLWNEHFRDYYENNLKLEATFKNKTYFKKDKIFVEQNKDLIFFAPYWPHVGNCMSEKSVTRKANEGEKESLERILNSNASYSYFIFKAKIERDNALQFWKSELNNQLILNNLTRNLFEKFPHIDWSDSKAIEALKSTLEKVK